jgi:hypothetical protein
MFPPLGVGTPLSTRVATHPTNDVCLVCTHAMPSQTILSDTTMFSAIWSEAHHAMSAHIVVEWTALPPSRSVNVDMRNCG